MTDKRTMRSFYLGSAIFIEAIININTATTATITIKDSENNTKVNAANMTKATDKVYNYTYQSLSTDAEGEYIVTLSFTYNSYTSVFQEKFTLIEQE